MKADFQRTVFSLFLAILFITLESVAFAQSLTPLGQWSLPYGETVATSAINGPTAYVVTLSIWVPFSHLKVINIADPQNPVFTSDTPLASSNVPFSGNGIALFGEHAYIACGDPGGFHVFVVNVADQTAPVIVKKIDLAWVTTVTIEGNRLYVGKGSGGFEIFSLADPDNPKSLGVFSTIAANDLKVADGLAYVAAGSGGLKIVDVTNPAAPWLVGGAASGTANRIAMRGSVAFVGSWDGQGIVRIFDITNPVTPALLSSIANPFNIVAISINDSMTAVAYNSAGVTVALYNTSNPQSPVMAGTLKLAAVTDVLLKGRYLYAAEGSAGFVVYDVLDPARRIRLGSLQVHSIPVGVRVAGNFAFISDLLNGIHIVDISNPNSPTRVADYIPPEDTGYPVGSVYPSGSNIMVPIWSGFDVVDLSVPTAPKVVSSFRGNVPVVPVITVSGNYVFTSGGDIVDVTDKSHPNRVGSLSPPVGITKFETTGNYIYYTTTSGIGVIDISNPLAPRLRGTLNLGYSASTALAWPNWYVRYNALSVFELSDPDNIRLVNPGTYDGLGSKVAVSGQKLFLSRLDLSLWDIRELSAPLLVKFVSAPPAIDLAAQGDFAFNLGGQGQFQIFQGALGPPPARPTLQLMRDGANLILRWPKDYADFKLHALSNFGDAWEIVTTTPAQDGDFLNFTNTRPLGNRFYKLIK